MQRDREFVATDVELAAAASFVSTILADDRIQLPRAAVVDVGVIARRGWAVVEQNAAWGVWNLWLRSPAGVGGATLCSNDYSKIR
ncbi:hypothetical protein [Chamaesiphon sp. VAR_48_metabat_403]|uniref:hypothetical protein n=1 Tax=Chamaesiphon sp. VAR_48_metabat_403 TaxID=2964700 RepID=UPI00286E3F0F|nr:hypothetical protein [Chamaesiphon sp. VAR_48_metabat_403]